MSDSVTALVVDDPRVLAELAGQVDWARLGVNATFAEPGAQATKAMLGSTFDVIVAGVSLRTRDGVDVLRHAARQHPATARVAVAAEPHPRWSSIAHQVLARPFSTQRLRTAIMAAIHLRDGVDSKQLLQLVNSVKRLPSLPNVYVKLQDELRSPDPSIGRIGDIIQQDPAISIRVLQMVNSPFFGLRREVADVAHAATLLGAERISSLVLAIGVFTNISNIDQKYVERLWQDSLAVSGIARRIAVSEQLPNSVSDDAQLAGLLHDIGELVLFQNWRAEFTQVDLTSRDEDERRLFGATHGEVSGYLCAEWGLPPGVVEAATWHHHPALVPSEPALSAVTLVHFARALVDAGLDPKKAVFDDHHLEDLGLEGRIDEWSSLAGTAA